MEMSRSFDVPIFEGDRVKADQKAGGPAPRPTSRDTLGVGIDVIQQLIAGADRTELERVLLEMRDAADRALYPVALILMGLVPAAILEFFIVLRVKASVYRKREARFAREYVPRFREFLEGRMKNVE